MTIYLSSPLIRFSTHSLQRFSSEAIMTQAWLANTIIYAPTPISLNIVDNFPTLTSSVGVKNATFEIFVQRSQPV